jgi:anti-sigma factor RsiW
MNCTKAGELLTERLFRELCPSERAELDAHLQDCAACRREAAMLSGSWDALADFEAPALDERFSAALMGRLRREQAQPETTDYAGWWKVPAFVLASCAVYVICVESGLAPSRGYERQSAAQPGLASIFADGRDGGGYLLSMVAGGGQ